MQKIAAIFHILFSKKWIVFASHDKDKILYAANSDMAMHQMAAHLLTETLTTATDQDDAVNEVKNILTQIL